MILKQYHSLEHAETKKYIFLHVLGKCISFIYIFILLRKINGLVLTSFTLEQNADFKLEINKDLTFTVIIIDID